MFFCFGLPMLAAIIEGMISSVSCQSFDEKALNKWVRIANS